MRLYDSFIERDLEAIPPAGLEFRRDHSSEELWQAVTRFAILAYAPSQHAKHALFSCLAAWDLRDVLGSRFDEMVTQCAVYAASSRQPWSEPPILDPPPVDANAPRDANELRQAIAGGDRLRAERWLAARFQDPDFAADFFAVASEDFEDLGHKLIAAVTAFRLAALLGEKGRFAALRVGIWEMVASRGATSSRESADVDPSSLATRLVQQMVAQRGEVVAAHRLFLLDSALQTEDAAVLAQACSSLQAEVDAEPPPPEPAQDPGTTASGQASGDIQVYALARDYGELLKSCAVARRLRERFPSIGAMRIIDAARDHLANAPSSDEFTFA